MTFLLALLIAPTVAMAADPIDRPHKADEVIIKFKDTASQADKNAILADIGATQIKHFKRIKSDHKRINGLTVGQAVGRYKNHPAIEYIEPNYELTINEIPNDPRFDELYGMLNTGQTGGTPGADISATSAWDVFTGSSNVVIGVIDTGVDYNHPDLAANIYTNPGEIPGNGIDDDGNGFVDDVRGWDFINNDNDPMDDNGHGTHCSGTIGGVGDNGIGVAGVNWNVSIMPLKFLSASGSGSTDDAIACIEYATMMGVQLTSNSWGGGGFSAAMEAAIADAAANNILFVAAAGNSSSNNDTSPHYPSSYALDNVIAVAATDHNDALASFSSYGATSVDIAAPGDDILSTLPGNSYGQLSGTSMATPHVAGAVGLIYGRFPAIDALDAKNLLLNFADPLPDLDGVVLSGGRLNAFMPIADPDSIPPGMISDLAVSTAGSNWLDLNWTAVGDDDYTGEASRYDLRYSTAPINDGNWDAATMVAGEPDPGTAGTFESMRLEGLDFSTMYYVAVKALDEFGNASPLSNLGMGTTLGAPDIAYNPASLSEALLTGGTAMQSISLQNVGQGTLDFVIPTPTLQGAPVTAAAYVELPKGALEPAGNPVTHAQGGPDAFGYRWIDSNDALGPVFAWTDISGIGSVALTTGDDATSGPFPLSFAFPYYGGDYNEVRVCSNGFLSLSSSSTAYSNAPLPSTGAPGHMIAPFWDDLDTGSGTVYYYDDGTRMIVQWEGVAHYGGGGPYSFQAILNADGSIEYLYNSIGAPDNSATVGIQNGTGTDGLTVAYNTAYVTDGLAVRIYAVPQWITVAPGDGTVWFGDSATLDVAFDASGLVGGIYDGVIRVISNDPDEGEVQIPVQLAVTGAPDIAVDPLYHDFGNLFVGATPTTTVVVRNTGTDLLTISGISIDEPAFTADVTSFALSPGAAQPVVVTFAPTLAQAYSGTMTINSDAPNDPVVTVSLAGVGQEPPAFAVNPTSLTSNLYTGDSEQQTLTLSNSGGADFTFDLDVQFDAEVTVHQYVERGKEEIDADSSGPVTEGQGGPDLYGYNWIDSDEPGGPVYSWTDISAIGTPVFSGTADDTNDGPFPIGFDFPFYGNDFGTFNVCSNGWVSFTSTSTTYSNSNLPASGAPGNLLAPFWDDLRISTSAGGNVYYHNDGARLIIQYDNVPKYYATGSLTFQVVLYPDGTIMYLYESMTGASLTSATVGIQNETGDDGLAVVYNADYIHDGLAVRFQAFPEWLSVGPTSGVIPPGGSLDVTAAFNAEGMFGGAYNADIVITSNDPSVPVLPVPATLNVTGAPSIAANSLSFDFGTVFVGQPTLQNLILSNIGTDELIISGWSLNSPAFNTSLTVPEFLGPTENLIETLGFSPTSVGTFSGQFTIASNDPVTPNLVIELTGSAILPPAVSVDPTSLSSALFTGEIETQMVTLSNTGESDLTWDATTLLGAAEAVPVHADVEYGKDDEDPRIGDPVTQGSGGPDVYGYRWKDSDEPGGPIFDWVEISTVGTPVFTTVSDDRNSGALPLPFAFPFYGNLFTEFYVCSNGWVSFTSTSTDLSNGLLPGTSAPENLLAMFHDDLRPDPSAGGNVYYHYDGSRFIIQYDNVPRYGSGGPYTFQAILYPNGTIIYQYLDMQGTRLDEATIGIQNAARDDGLTVAFNTDYVHNDLAIRLAPVSDWLTVSPASGTVPPGGSTMLDVTFNAADLFGGLYEGAVRILNNDPNNGLIEIPATLDVTGVPVLAVDPAALAFGDVYIGYPETLELVVSNDGTDDLIVTGITAGNGDFTADPAAFTLIPFQTQTVTVTFGPTAEGDRSTDLTIASNDANSPMIVPVSGNGVVPPDVAWSPDPMVGAAIPGYIKTKTLTICNEGGSDLNWSLSGSESIAANMVPYPELKLGKNEEDPRQGVLGSGGPDVYGYTWIDSDDPAGPAFVWQDISGVGTPTFSGYSDDGNRGPFPIGFDFPFYGNTFSEFRVSSNGFISFTSTVTDYSNDPLPSAGGPENLIALFWDDMVVDPLDGGEIYYYNDGTRLIVQFEVRRIGTGGNPPFYSMQAMLYPDGTIVYQYAGLGTNTTSATIGIQNATRDDGLMMVYNADYVHEDMAIMITSAPSWLSVGTESGVVPAGECVDVEIVMDATELPDGDYEGTLTLTSNDPDEATVHIPVMFHVDWFPAEDVDVEPHTLNLSSNGKYMTGRVELPVEYDLNDIVLETVRFNDVVPAEMKFFEIGDFNENGIPDVSFKFDRSAIEDILPEGEQVPVQIIGEIRDTIWFIADDTIRVIQPTMLSPNGNETYLMPSPITITWADPEGVNVDYADLYYTIDDGESWNLIASNLTENSYTWTPEYDGVEAAKVRVLVFDNQGLLGYDSSDEPFVIADSASPVEIGKIPTVYALKAAYPNPFNPKTEISFDLPKPGATRLVIYDVKGRLVTELVSGQMTAGTHSVTWTGNDSDGRRVASGVYYYRITSGSFTSTRPMTLLK